ncbi:MAG: amidase, partial [Pyrinomonadaceae bacterium]
YRAPEYEDLIDMYEKTRAQGFGAEVKRRILIGTYVLSHGYYDAYYLKAQKLRRQIAQDFSEAFKTCDVIMGPTSPTTAFKLGEKSNDPIAMYLSDIYTISVNLAALPGMSIPAGLDASGLPIGLQIIGNYFDEARLLNIAHQYQQVTDWHSRTPIMSGT